MQTLGECGISLPCKQLNRIMHAMYAVCPVCASCAEGFSLQVQALRQCDFGFMLFDGDKDGQLYSEWRPILTGSKVRITQNLVDSLDAHVTHEHLTARFPSAEIKTIVSLSAMTLICMSSTGIICWTVNCTLQHLHTLQHVRRGCHAL